VQNVCKKNENLQTNQFSLLLILLNCDIRELSLDQNNYIPSRTRNDQTLCKNQSIKNKRSCTGRVQLKKHEIVHFLKKMPSNEKHQSVIYIFFSIFPQEYRGRVKHILFFEFNKFDIDKIQWIYK